MDASTPALTDSDTVADQAAPPVVAVMVTCNPGWWMEECLSSLAAQDYPALSVLVIDADSAEDPTARVAAVMPTAFVRRVRRRRGFAAAANEVLSVVEGASHFLFCHDDVSLAPSSVRVLVEEAFRSNAGVVAPKLVGWFHPDRLLAVGMGMDPYGVPVPLVERGDLDQEQHDTVRDVFIAPSPCVLVRADLFATLGGFDAGCGLVGEDRDLSWRAHLLGARVVAAPGAAVRHLEATEMGRRALDGSLRTDVSDVSDVSDVGDATTGPAPAPRAIPTEHTPAPADVWEDSWTDDDAEGASGTTEDHGGHHASWRARREAERELALDTWLDGDEDWDLDEWSPRRRRRRAFGGDFVPPAEEEVRGPDATELDELREVARLRAVISNYGATRLVTRVPLLLAVTAVGAVVHLWREGSARARRFVHPWVVMVLESGALRTRRKAVRRTRSVGDGEIVDQQVRGSGRLGSAVRAATRGKVVVRAPDLPLAVGVWIGAFVLLALGSRHLLARHLPLVGELRPWPSLGTLMSSASSGWRLTGLGVAGPAPTAFGLLSVGGTALLGHMALLQHVLVLGMVPLGGLGVYRLARGLGSRRAQAVALVAYLAVPLPYNAVAGGHWSGLVAYGATPWVLALLLRATGLAPFDVVLGGGQRPPRPALSMGRRVVALALVTALAAAVQPGFIVVVLVLGVGLAAGAASTHARTAGTRALTIAVLGSVSSLVLLFPWVLSWLPPTGEWATFTGVAPGGGALHLATLLRFQTGPLGAGVIGYALLVAAALPLIVGRAWRADWAIRLWAVALLAFGVAWAGQHGALGAVWPPADVLLAPAAVAIALSVALGMASFDTDLAGFTFGWRQVVAGVAASATLIACLPIAAAAADGRWQQRSAGYDSLLSWMTAKRVDGDFRVLWVGSPAVLPIAGWRLADGLAYASSRNGSPDLTTSWPGTSYGTTRLLGQALELVRRDDTADVGHLLAPMGVRYIVVVQSPAPLDTRPADQRPIPVELRDGLAAQLDLFPVDQGPQSSVFENAAWMPVRARLPDPAVPAATLDDPRAARTAQLNGSQPLLPTGSGTTYSGDVPTGAAVEVAEAPSGHWQLSVVGRPAPRRPAFAAATLFSVGAGGHATLRYRTPLGWRVAALLGIALWLAAIGLVIDGRRRRRAR